VIPGARFGEGSDQSDLREQLPTGEPGREAGAARQSRT